MISADFIKRIEHQKYIEPDALVRSLEEPSPISIRINPLKWSRSPLKSEPVQWCQNGFYLPERPSFTLDPLFHAGCYYPQEASSMYLAEVMRQTTDLSGRLKVLDLCAAPGGKSTQISEIISRESLLVSNDAIKARASILAETISKWGSGKVIVTQNDPSAFGRLPGFFDVIVVDAPCSGEGMFRSETARMEWSPDNAALCCDRQKRILMEAWPALKENGILIYSTCTFNPGENEENIKWLSEKNDADSLKLNISAFDGITEIQTGNIYGYGFYPNKIKGEGFFISAVRKNGAANSKMRYKSGKDIFKPGRKDLEVIKNATTLDDSSVFRYENELFSMSGTIEEYLYLSENLRIINAPQKLFEVKNDKYIPAHELALSTYLKAEAFPRSEVSLSEALQYLKKDNLNLKMEKPGWVMLTYKNTQLGFVNNIGSRINNYYPVNWRIRMSLPEQGYENILRWDSET
jgi:16S rRNA C967 or C1407 C5-methylase (RsmB/RsmF family)/NOL1/NOP2/fmu family ribosome biogenesis protein